MTNDKQGQTLKAMRTFPKLMRGSIAGKALAMLAVLTMLSTATLDWLAKKDGGKACSPPSSTILPAWCPR
jgi:hypothetical protein